MSDHTPTPWRVGDAGTTIFGPKRDAPSPVTVAALKEAGGAYRANAQFIVTACNAHEGLVAACGFMLDLIDHTDVRLAIGRAGMDTFAKMAREEASAALAKATGGDNE